jgi:hypothetical protein
MKSLLVVLALLVVPAAAEEGRELHQAEHHGCRIARIETRVRRQVETGLYHLTAIYRAADGRQLTQEACPDQNQPSWGNIAWTPEDRVVDRFGYEVLVRFQPGPVHFTVSTTQGHFVGAPDPVLPTVVIYTERDFLAR